MMYGWFRWDDILFTHWRVPARELKARLPDGVTLDLHKGRAWVSLVATNTIGPVPRQLITPTLEPVLGYAQINIRTYVVGPQGPGIVFLDTRVSSIVAALGASMMGQPYRYAAAASVAQTRTRAQVTVPGGTIDASIAPGAPATAVPGSLAHFLVERYVVYAALPTGLLYATRISHEPFLLRDAAPLVTGAPLARLAGIEDAEGPFESHAAEPVIVAITAVAGADPHAPAPDRH